MPSNAISKSNASRGQKQKNSVDLLLSPPEQKHIEVLAEEIQHAMAALYNVHTALVNVANGKEDHPLLRNFKPGLSAFVVQCDSITVALRKFHGNATDYISLVEFIPSQPLADCVIFAKPMVPRAKQLLDEVKVAAKMHKACTKSLFKSEKEMRRAFNPLEKTKAVKKSDKSVVTAPREVKTFLEASKNALRPDGTEALEMAKAAMLNVASSIQQLQTSCQKYHAHIKSVKPQQIARSITSAQVGAAVTAWKSYQRALNDTISSISESSTAITIDPPNSSKTEKKANGSIPFWRRWFGKG